MLSITKLQNLKAIHNICYLLFFLHQVVINHKTTKFESNSQPLPPEAIKHSCCYQSQNYKIWKQFTTSLYDNKILVALLSITKLQNLKAIHNIKGLVKRNIVVVINHKTTKFESNSQQYQAIPMQHYCCYQSQNYKIWKQFTTAVLVGRCVVPLLSITKLQNLKAIHNTVVVGSSPNNVVINHKTTKFESNSQQVKTLMNLKVGCYQSQNYKIWKQFTTRSS